MTWRTRLLVMPWHAKVSSDEEECESGGQILIDSTTKKLSSSDGIVAQNESRDDDIGKSSPSDVILEVDSPGDDMSGDVDRLPSEEEAAPSSTSTTPEADTNNNIISEDVMTPREKWKRRKAVAIYMVTLTFLYADMNLLAPNLSQIADEFGFDEDERDRRIGGHIAVAFFLVGAPVSFLVGWLADSHKRAPLFAITVFIGEAACFAVYFTTTFQGLFICRVFTGIAVGGSLPIVYSVLGDIYKAGHRAAISAVVSTGTGIGIAIGHGLAGYMDSDWRLPFLIVSIPSFFCALLVLTVEEPKRGGKEAARLEIEMERRRLAALHSEDDSPAEEPVLDTTEDETPTIETENTNELVIEPEENELLPVFGDKKEKVLEEESLARESAPELVDLEDSADSESIDEEGVTWKTTKDLLKTPSVILILLQGAPACLPFGMTAVYLNDYLSEDQGMGKDEATNVLIFFGAGNAIGVILGGILGHCSYRRDVRYPPIIMGTCVILSAIPMWGIINKVDESTNVGVAGTLGVLAGLLAIIPIPIERAILANVSLPEARGRANSFLGVVDDLGKGLGPVFVSLLIDAFGRTTAFNLSLLGFLIGGFISLFLYCTVRQDESRIQELVRESLERQEERQQSDQEKANNTCLGGDEIVDADTAKCDDKAHLPDACSEQ